MLNQIRIAPHPQKDPHDAVEMLLGCHERIRHFSEVARGLSHSQDADLEQIRAAAQAAYRYFTVALPIHEADENESLHPRLKQALPAGNLAGSAADAMVDQHNAIDELLERLLPLLRLLEHNPVKQPDVASEMCALTSRLDDLFRVHLELEEKTVFPAIEQCLGEVERKALAAEMQARRK